MAGEDPEHLARLRAMPCGMCDRPPPSDAHHSTHGRGTSQKTHDHLAMPLCHGCHMDFHGATGRFKGMTKAERRMWQAAMSEVYMPRPPADGVF